MFLKLHDYGQKLGKAGVKYFQKAKIIAMIV